MSRGRVPDLHRSLNYRALLAFFSPLAGRVGRAGGGRGEGEGVLCAAFHHRDL